MMKVGSVGAGGLGRASSAVDMFRGVKGLGGFLVGLLDTQLPQ